MPIAAQFLRCQKAFLLTTAAQNIHVLFRKSPLLKEHFFEWLKTENFSTACGTVTLKSAPSRGADAPHIHQRLRKRLARCTSLYLVLKSNGLRHSKNLPVKFGFSSKSVPANIVQKLPSQRCSKPLFIAFFNFSHKRLTFAFTGKNGYTLSFRRRIAHSGSHGETGAFRTGVVSLPSDRSARFGNPAWPGGRTANFAAFGSWSEVLSKNAESLRDSDALMRVAVPRRRGPAGLRDPVSALLIMW